MAVSKLQWPKNLGFNAVIETVTTNGVLTPLLWTVGALNIPAIFLAYFESPLAWGFFGLSAICVAWILKSFDHFRDKAPNLLQSEKFQLAHQKQQGAIEAAMRGQVLELELTANPQARLENKGEQNG